VHGDLSGVPPKPKGLTDRDAALIDDIRRGIQRELDAQGTDFFHRLAVVLMFEKAAAEAVLGRTRGKGRKA
jgi:hypothetical protein